MLKMFHGAKDKDDSTKNDDLDDDPMELVEDPPKRFQEVEQPGETDFPVKDVYEIRASVP